MGNGECLRRVVVHWVNLPSIWPADVLSLDNRSWIGRWSVQASGWTHTLDSRADHTKVVSQATRDDAPYVVTHVAELTRTDGDAFTGSQAIDVLFAWQLALSFALGRFVAPALPVGFDDQNRRVWEHWAPWRCDTLTGYQAWWDNHTADDLAGFVDNYIAAYLNPKGHDLVRWMVMHLITANHAGTTGEGKVMLAQAGLDYFAWVTLVLSGTMSRTEYEKLNAAERLRHVLERAGLPPGVPDDLDALYQLAHERTLDGPGAAVWVRNRLTHPKDAGEPYRLEGLVWQAAQLLLEYGELLLLHHLEYSGPFTHPDGGATPTSSSPGLEAEPDFSSARLSDRHCWLPDRPRSPGVGGTEGVLSPAPGRQRDNPQHGSGRRRRVAAARSSVWSQSGPGRGRFRQANAPKSSLRDGSGGTSAANRQSKRAHHGHARGASVCLAGRQARSRDRVLRRVELYHHLRRAAGGNRMDGDDADPGLPSALPEGI